MQHLQRRQLPRLVGTQAVLEDRAAEVAIALSLRAIASFHQRRHQAPALTQWRGPDSTSHRSRM